MSRYRLRFFIETSLNSRANVAFRYRDTDVTFLFAERKENEEGVEAELCVEADNHVQAIEFAQSHFLHAVLDAIAFQRHTSLSVRHWTLILKAERGLRKRRFILARNSRHPEKLFIDDLALFEVQKILDGQMMLALRWMRNSYRPMPIFDEFVFLWLALENLSGTVQQPTYCGYCKKKVICETCRIHPEHNASDRQGALKIIEAFDKTIDKKTFNTWWNELRNKAFHGRTEPTIELISKMKSAIEIISPAIEDYLRNLLGVQLKYRPQWPVGPNFTVRMVSHVEFDINDPTLDFPAELPDFAQIQNLSQPNPQGTYLLSPGEFANW
jgi:hypothetical protein